MAEPVRGRHGPHLHHRTRRLRPLHLRLRGAVTHTPFFGGQGGAIPVEGDVFDVQGDDVGGLGGAPSRQPQPFDVDPVNQPMASLGFPRDTFWPRNAAAFVGLGIVLTLLSTQLVAPTRRLHLRLRRRGTGELAHRDRTVARGSTMTTSHEQAPDPEPGTLPARDPRVTELTHRLRRFQRRLWLRRVVRGALRVGAVALLVALALVVVGRIVRLDWLPAALLAVALGALLAIVIDAARVRPTSLETALALDGGQGLADRLSTAVALGGVTTGDPDTDELLSRQRQDALASVGQVQPGAIGLTAPRRATVVALAGAALLVGAAMVPDPWSAMTAEQEHRREVAAAQAERLEEAARRLEADPARVPERDAITEELRRLAAELRERPDGLEDQLARMGALEDRLRSRIDRGAEQRASAISALSGELSRAAGREDGWGPPRRRRRTWSGSVSG